MLRVCILLLCLFPATLAWAGDLPVPREVAGIRIGMDVEELAPLLVEETSTPIFRAEGLKRAAVIDLPGFRSGYVVYGDCVDKGRVVRFKLNYEDDSKSFFERILKVLEKRYGRPQDWRGNPFGTLRIWKWGFTAEDGDSISMILSHYSGDDDAYTEGNAIRIANRTAMNREIACGREDEKKDPPRKPAKKEQKDVERDFEYFLPR